MTEKGHKKTDLRNLPSSVAEFVKLVIQKMRYRKVVREEVQAELSGQFEDELKDFAPDEEREQKARQLIAEFGDVKLLAVLLRRAKKRCRPLWRTAVVRTFQTAGVLLLCFILYTVWFVSGKPIVRIDYLAQLNQMGRPQISIGDNAWPHYERAIELYVEPSSELDGMPAWRSWNEPAYRSFAVLSEQERREIEQWIAPNEAAWQEFVAGSSRPYCYREYTRDKGDMLLDVVLPHLATLRHLFTVGVWRSRMHIEQGETARALDDCLAVARAGSHWQGWGTIIEQLHGLAISRAGYEEILYIVATKEVSAADLKRLQQQLSQIYPRGYPLMNVEGERLVFHDIIQHTFTDGGLGGGHLVPRRLISLKDVAGTHLELDQFLLSTAIGMVHARRDQTLRIGNEIYDRISWVSKMKPYERHVNNVNGAEEMIVGLSPYRYLFLRSYVPTLSRACEYVYRGRALHEATLTVLALNRRRLEEGGYPTGLNELVTAGYLEQVPMDPYSDKPIVYKKTGDDFVLYSLGQNFADDGGKLIREGDEIEKWGTEEEGDAVFWPIPKSQAKKKDIYEKHEQTETYRKTIL